jgi:riboflavin kinase/FMN adenylyltransferase
MKILRSIEELSTIPGPSHVAIGVFDGIHLGHQAVIKCALENARQQNGRTIVVTFHPHPVRILRPEKAPRLLTSTPHKIDLIQKLGVDAVLVLDFSPEFAKTPPALFIERLASFANQLKTICVGEEWTFGANRAGSVDLLKELAVRFDFKLGSIAPVVQNDQIVSSTWIRAAVESGDLNTAARLLGRPFTILGTVTQGKRLGRKLGFPTANLRAHNEQFPPNGVYAAQAWIEGVQFGGVVNIGVRPTIENDAGERILELHLFGFNKDIYGQDVEVEFLQYLRPERKFSGIDELRAQIERDASEAKRIYEKQRANRVDR